MKKTVSLVLLFLFGCFSAAFLSAEEVRHGRYIYVPAAESNAEGSYRLRAEYMPVAEEGESAEPQPLAGAEFGVYVISGDGEPAPWANSLYPWEPLRLRTGEEPVRFSLPKGIDFFIRQESAPEGILFDSTKLIPVTGKEIVVRNEAEGELVISARDSLGTPLSGTVFSVRDSKNGIATYRADENGNAVIPVKQEDTVRISETLLPDGAFEAKWVLVSGKESDAFPAEARILPGVRTHVDFAHPASGLVQVRWSVTGPDESGEIRKDPLPGVTILIGGQEDPLTTDGNGEADVTMLEGRYPILFSYPGNDAILTVERGEMIVSSGATTLIELAAVRPDGRVRVQTNEENPGIGSYTLRNAETQEEHGPYSLSGNGISDLLSPGEYEVFLQLPEDHMLEGWLLDGSETAGKPESLAVSAGKLTDMELLVRRLETRRIPAAALRIGDDGQYEREMLPDGVVLTLYDEAGNALQTVQVKNGAVSLTAADGVYTAQMEDDAAAENGLEERSDPFRFSEEPDEGIGFREETARLVLQSVNAEGIPLAGAVYRVSGAGGTEQTVICDASGRGVSAPVPAGQTAVETVASPEGYDDAPPQSIVLEAGRVAEAVLTHAALGEISLLTRLQSLDERANPMTAALPDAEVQVTAAEDAAFASSFSVRTDAGGEVRLRLKAGDYLARISDTQNADARIGEPVAFHVENEAEESVQLTAYAPLGGILLHLTGGESGGMDPADARFSVSGPDGKTQVLQFSESGLYAAGLYAGEYLLQELSGDGFASVRPRTVRVKGGEVTEISISLSEIAALSVSKIGLTFNRNMETFSVPLSGEYRIYTEEGDELVPYPSADAQLSVWANVDLSDSSRPSEVRLPAGQDGTAYVLREAEASAGFTADEEIHRIVLRAGETARPVFAVANDRGFFRMSVLDAETGESLSGGEYALCDEDGREILSFPAEAQGYTNETALPVGNYVLRQLAAPQGYALSDTAETRVKILPWLYAGNSETDIAIRCVRIPGDASLRMELSLRQPADGEYLVVESGRMPQGIRLLEPVLTLRPLPEWQKRLSIRNVTVSGTGDGSGNPYRARIEYELRNGGWQPGSAVLTETLDIPRTVSFDSIPEDVSALRLVFIRADSGEETAEAGFTPGQIHIALASEGEEESGILLRAEMSGVFLYRLVPEKAQALSLTRSAERSFAVPGSGDFGAESGGRDGSVTGTAFLDTDGDGLLEQAETGRYAGLTVRLLDASGDPVDVTRTDAEGRYAFRDIPLGEYRLQFLAGDSLVYSMGSLYSDHMISHIEDGREGLTGRFMIDADHTDYVRNAGCLYAAALNGSVFAVQSSGEMIGMSGIGITLAQTGKENAESRVSVTGEDGSFAFPGLYPGDYRLDVSAPEGYIPAKGSEKYVTQALRLSQGETAAADEIRVVRAASVEGMVWYDEDGDGKLSDPIRFLPEIPVRLLSVQEDHTDLLQETVTDPSGAFCFTGIQPGTYLLQAELDEGYAFTQYTEHARVYGAAGRTGETQRFALAAGEQMEDVFIGATRPGRMEVRVFADERADGVKGLYDTGLADVALHLIRMESGRDAGSLSAVSDSDGVAVFENVSPGAYVLSYEMPGQWRTTRVPERASAGSVVSEVPSSSERIGKSEAFVLTAGENRIFVIGAAVTGSITGIAFLDLNANGIRDTDEPGLPGIGTELLDANGATFGRTATGEDGSYRFEGLAEGQYSVRFTAAQDCGFSGSDRTMQSGSAESTTDSVSSTRMIPISAGKAFDRADAAIVHLANLSGIVWEDADADGRPGEAEAQLAEVSVDLMNGAGRIVLQSGKTDGDGRFAFERLLPGTYLLRILLPNGYVFTDQADGALAIANLRGKYGYSAAFAMADGETIGNADFGVLTEGSIAGTVWQDENYNGIMDAAEGGIRGATVTLLDGSGDRLYSVRTDRKGAYLFEKLKPGRYSLEVQLPAGYVFTADGGDSLAARSDLPTSTVQLGQLTMGEKRYDVNVGALLPSSISGTVWFDADDDGRMRIGENGVPDVTVTLRMTSGKDEDREIRTVTDERGAYQVQGVMPGTAVLIYRLPDGYAFARNAAGRSRVSTVPVTDATEASAEPIPVAMGKTIEDRDVGIVSVGTVDGHLRETETGEGKQTDPGIAGANVQMLDASSGEVLRETATDEDGAFAFAFVRKGVYSFRMDLPGGRIFAGGEQSAFEKTDESWQKTAELSLAMGESKSDLDAYGIRSAHLSGRVHLSGTDEGIPGAVVSLLSGGTVIRSSETDAMGAYTFKSLRPGSYRLRYMLPAKALFAAGTHLEMQNQDAAEAETPSLDLSAGQELEADAVSAVWGASISGTAWLDRNADGRMGTEEERLSGVLVHLVNGRGEATASVYTDDRGQYAFDRLREGDYRLFFTLPAGMLFTDRIRENGASVIEPTENSDGLTETITLPMGRALDGFNVGAIRPGEIGDSVWIDENGNGLQDYREPLLPGVTLRLTRETGSGEVLDAHEIKSDEYGYFMFRALRPGRYRLEAAAEDGYALTVHIGAPLAEIDSDLNPETGKSDVILLESGQTLRNVDVGFLRK